MRLPLALLLTHACRTELDRRAAAEEVSEEQVPRWIGDLLVQALPAIVADEFASEIHQESVQRLPKTGQRSTTTGGRERYSSLVWSRPDESTGQ